jgi:hypothetical protein
MRQTYATFFGTKLVVKYWQAKHENRECCPQHGALSAVSAGLAFLAVNIAVSEPFLLPAAENWSQLHDMFWHQIRSLIFIAKPRRRTDLDDNTEL